MVRKMNENEKERPTEDKPKKKPGRPKGSKNKPKKLVKKKNPHGVRKSWAGGRDRSKYLLNKLEENNFNLIGELLERYHVSKQVFMPIAEKMATGVELTVDEMAKLDRFGKEGKEILFRLLGYAYPKLKATEIQAGAMDRVVFNIMPNNGEEKENQNDSQEKKTPGRVINLVKTL